MKPPRASPIAMVAFAVFLGCVMDALVKHLGSHVDAITIGAWRFGFGAIFSIMAFAASKPPLPDWSQARWLLARGVVQTTSAVAFFHALSILLLSEAVVIGFAAPMILAGMAMTFLREPARPWALAAIAVGFAGVLVTVSGAPPQAADSARRLEGVIAIVFAAFAYAGSNLLLSLVARRSPASVVSLFGNVLPAAMLIPISLAMDGLPRMADMPDYAFAGALGFFLWHLMSVGYSRAPAQRLAVMEYTALVWGTLFGLAFFNETPRLQVYAGAAIIMASIALAAWDERRARAVPPS